MVLPGFKLKGGQLIGFGWRKAEVGGPGTASGSIPHAASFIDHWGPLASAADHRVRG